MIRKIEAGTTWPSKQLAFLFAEGLALPEEEHAAFVQWARAASRARGASRTAPPLTEQPLGPTEKSQLGLESKESVIGMAGSANEQTTLSVREVEKFSFEHVQAGWKAYLLDVLGTPFGRLYTMPMASTFVWRGAIDFANLEEDVLHNLHLLIANTVRKDSSIEHVRAGTVVSLVASGRILDYRLSKQRQHQDFRAMLDDISMISFARFDVSDMLPPSVAYSFTAENSQLSSEGRAELAVKLYVSEFWSAGVIDWVVRHHTASIDIEKVVECTLCQDN